jgi:sigma-B regulation protein RsbU (phosphoserine phosphatase)
MTAGLKTAEEAKLAQKAAEQELALASRIQSRLLPGTPPVIHGLELAVHYVPAKVVGGDYYDFLRLGSEALGLAVADVSGKGVPASLIMTMTRSLLRMAAREARTTARTVELLNRSLTPDLNPGMFVTLAYCIIGLEARTVELVRAGHNPPFLVRAADGKVERLAPRGVGLGLDRKGGLFEAELETARFRLESGDCLVLYTDGVVEAKDRAGKDYGEDRLASVLAASAKGPARGIVDAIVKDVARHERGAEAADDVTIVVVKAVP